MRPPPGILAVLFLLLAAPAGAEIATLAALRDNTLFEDAQGDTSNGAGPAFFAGRNSQGRLRRAVLAFDLAGVVPAGARIDAVTLALEVSSAPDTISRPFALHRLLRSWGEGTSSSSGGGGAPATPGDATWLHTFHPLDPWAVPGGDFAPEASAFQVIGDVGPVAFAGAGLVADIERWCVDPASNHGWMLRADETAPRSVRRFDSREAAAPARPPTLTIEYTPTEPAASFATSWGRLKSAYR